MFYTYSSVYVPVQTIPRDSAFLFNNQFRQIINISKRIGRTGKYEIKFFRALPDIFENIHLYRFEVFNSQ